MSAYCSPHCSINNKIGSMVLPKGGNETVVLTEVSGNFDGSPVQLHYHFTLKGDKIAALSIRD